MTALEAEMTRAARVLSLARWRMLEHRRVYGGVDRDLARRLRDALRQVRWLETLSA
jgi:hypothetical protein